MIVPKSPSSLVLFSTVRIATQNTDGSESFGTAFFFRFKVDDKTSVPVLVTNKHVVSGANKGVFFVHEAVKNKDQSAPAEGSFGIAMPAFEKQWTGHPGDVDLCAIPFEPVRQQALAEGKDIFYVALDEDLIPTQTSLENLAALEEIVMVGYPIGLWDESSNFPLLRRGITASHPATSFCGKPIGVADIAAFPGSSGSPILIMNEGSFATPEGITIGTRLIFLGILFAGPQFGADGNISIVDVPTTRTPVARTMIPAHLGYYIKAAELEVLKRHMFSVLGIEVD